MHPEEYADVSRAQALLDLLDAMTAWTDARPAGSMSVIRNASTASRISLFPCFQLIPKLHESYVQYMRDSRRTAVRMLIVCTLSLPECWS